MKIKEYLLPFGREKIKLKVEQKNLMGVLLPEEPAAKKREEDIIKQALSNPIGSPPLSDIVKPKDKIAIITSDITRPTPSKKMLPSLLEELKRRGVKKENIKIIFALGIHRKHTPKEKEELVGKEIYEEYRCIDHDPENCLSIGETENGLPVEIFKEVAEADVKICLGNIEPHYFAGYTGGAKSIMPGVSSQKSVSSTHRLMLLPGSVAGKIEGNPTRKAIEEVGEKVGIDFILNVILNSQKRTVKAVAGDRILAHRTGCEFADKCFKVPIKEKADIVIVSAGGYPKDINVYQAQKALDNAKYAVKEGGTIILVAECKEGFGDRVFEKWMLEATSFKDPVERLKKEFVLGGHKACAIGMLLEKAKVILVSSLPEEKVKKLFFTPANSLQEAVSLVLKEYGKDAGIYIIPSGGITLPHFAV
ncbi:nickel-dependent lactate racemase [Candidatus Aerophobetes bacterium]|nr:nickel-dependent lactate racemase [Candidatus Aerophobetes bacterium]